MDCKESEDKCCPEDSSGKDSRIDSEYLKGESSSPNQNISEDRPVNSEDPEVQNDSSQPDAEAVSETTEESYTPFHQKKKSYDDMPITEYIQMKVKERMRVQAEEEAKQKAERDKKRKEEKEKQDALMKSVQETISRNKEILSSTENTLTKLKTTIDGLKETEKRFEDFQNQFSNLMSSMLTKAFGDQEDIEEMKAQYGFPRISSFEEAAMSIFDLDSVVVLIGAGVSAESGVFTYKESTLTWEVEGQELRHQDMANIDVLQSNPLEFWQYFQYTRFEMSTCKPNAVHHTLGDLIGFYRSISKKITLITQNIDGFEKEVLGDSEDLIELHGNINKMKCLFNCSDEIYDCPGLDTYFDSIPICPNCSGITRPNVLLFGETYTEEMSRSETASKAVEEAQCLIVVGTQLQCTLPNSLVRESAKLGKLIIEVNVEPVIEYGNVLFIPDMCGNVIPPMVHLIQDRYMSVMG